MAEFLDEYMDGLAGTLANDKNLLIYMSIILEDEDTANILGYDHSN